MQTGHRFQATDLHQFVKTLFTHMGSSLTEASLIADHLIAANLAGHDSHGVGMIPSYVRSHAQGYLQLNRARQRDEGRGRGGHAGRQRRLRPGGGP